MNITSILSNSLRNRFRLLKEQPIEPNGETVLYWMERDQRIDDNWALIAASEIAKELKKQLVIIFNYDINFYGSELRRIDFIIQGLNQVEAECEKLNIPFIITHGNSEIKISS